VTVPPKDQTQYKVDERGVLRIPPKVLRQIGVEAKMRVTFRVDGKALVIERAAELENPLDGDLSRNLDRDLFGKIQQQQKSAKQKAEDLFQKGLREAPSDPEPPDNPFRWD
jgi:antitoxin component of MazEF toxin-antitoxin module